MSLPARAVTIVINLGDPTSGEIAAGVTDIIFTGTFTVGGLLTDGGGITIQGSDNLSVEGGVIILPAGSASSPSINFGNASGDSNTGIYWVGADQIGISTGGTLRATFSTTALTLASGYNLTLTAATLTTQGLVAGITTKTDNYTATATDHTIIFNIATAKTLSLPAAASHTGRIYFVKNLSTSSDDLTIDPNGGELIDGAATLPVPAGFGHPIQSDGTGWHTLGIMSV